MAERTAIAAAFGRPALVALACTSLVSCAAEAQSRRMTPDDLFRTQQIGGIVWSPDNTRASVEISHPGRWIAERIPTSEIAIVDARNGTLRRVAVPTAKYLGFFNAAWSPDGGRLAFLSAGTGAVLRAWVWTVGAREPVMLRGLQVRDAPVDPPMIAWTDNRHVITMARDSTRRNSGPFYVSIMRDRNAADIWSRAHDARTAAVIATDTHDSNASYGRVVSIDVVSGTSTTLVQGPIHRAELSSDRRTLSYWRENPPLGLARVANYLDIPGSADAAYVNVAWGGERHHVDPHSGAEMPASVSNAPVARDANAPALRVRFGADGTRLVMTRPGVADITVWTGNAWIREVRTGRTQAIAYTSTDGKPLTGWLLTPPDYTSGERLPIVMTAYPGTTYGDRAPASFNVLTPDFEHPQLFAALGYGVVVASMPVSDDRAQGTAWAGVTQSVLPLIDTIVARGIADPKRLAFIGQSAGGYATLALISQTDRFRTAIASAPNTDLSAEYGEFYGEYRYGDAGRPQMAQLLRMLQFERGVVGAPAPPWIAPEWYRANSPISHVADVHTPVMLVKGESDFIPVQQAEEYFTALYRQDKRAVLVRYVGEGHTITARENVLDLWRRMEAWLRETMPK
jgi:dipeptidyl aminopeptidase/acylaminoacyl peptidase